MDISPFSLSLILGSFFSIFLEVFRLVFVILAASSHRLTFIAGFRWWLEGSPVDRRDEVSG
jgi:hypothetical protein